MVTSENDSQTQALAERMEIRFNDGGHLHEAVQIDLRDRS